MLKHFIVALAVAPCILASCGEPIEQALAPDARSPGEPITQTVKIEAKEEQVKQAVTAPSKAGAKVDIETPRSGYIAPPSPNPAPQTFEPSPAPALAKVVLTGYQPFFDVKKCMNVANALEAPNEGEWGYKVRTQELREIAKAGFDTIRLPVRWDSHMASTPPYAVSAMYMERVKHVVSQAQILGLGVILDVHHYEDLIESPQREQARFLALWSQIAQQFSGAPKDVYFEILNEPTNAMSMRDLNALYAKVIPLIRATNPTRTLIIGGNSWNSVDTMEKIAWPSDKNMVATFHDYGPHEFTHQGAPWTSDQWPLGREWGRKSDIAELKDTYEIAARFQAKRNVPVLVGEFGVIDTVPQDERNAWVKARRKSMEAAGYSWCAWDLTGAFKSYNLEARQWRPGVLDSLFGP